MTDFTIAFKVQGASPDVPRDMYHLAQSFYLAGNRASLNIEVAPNLTQSLLSPSVVNFCFSLELFFKALIQKSGTVPLRTHKLLELFNQLDATVQEEIKKVFVATIQQPNFDDFLLQINEYFQKVRYEYDYPIEIYYEGPIAQFARIVYIHCAGVFGYDTSIPPVSV